MVGWYICDGSLFHSNAAAEVGLSNRPLEGLAALTGGEPLSALDPHPASDRAGRGDGCLRTGRVRSCSACRIASYLTVTWLQSEFPSLVVSEWTPALACTRNRPRLFGVNCQE